MGSNDFRSFAKKQKKNSKLTIKEQLELVDEMVGKNNTKYLEDPRYKEYKSRITTIGNALVDSEGYIDLTEAFGTNIIFQSLPFKEKLKGIFITIDENGDGFLSRPEVEKFFTIILKNTFNVLRNAFKNNKEFGLSDENANDVSKYMPDLERVFDLSKLTRLVNGAFTADTNNDGLISFMEWETFIEAGNFVEQWGTISMLFDNQ